MFPRYRFTNQPSEIPKLDENTDPTSEKQPQAQNSKDKTQEPDLAIIPSHGAGEIDMPPRTYIQKLALVHYFKDDRTTWFQYFRRPFYLFLFPNIVLAGIQFAFGCTAGIVSFNTISEIMTEPSYNWSAGSAGLLFLAALVGNFIGYTPLPSLSMQPFIFTLANRNRMGIGSLSDWIVLVLARRNKGYKEPEMRLWAYAFSLLLAAVGYFTYGWGATAGAHWISIAAGLCCMIAQQVSATSIATAYAMECFDQVLPLPILSFLAVCSYMCVQLTGCDIDIRRTSDRARDLLVSNQLCDIVFCAEFHRCDELWVDVYVLWDLGAFVDGYGGADDCLGEELETEM